MSWSLKLGKIAGIQVQVHLTFVIFMVWIALSGLMAGKTAIDVLANAGFTLGLFTCVVLHEFGHALTAAHYGIQTKDITLLPIGGVARLERMPEDPKQELWVALAGPAVNVVIAAVTWIVLAATRGGPNLTGINMENGSFLDRIFLVNIFLVLFNMLPAFPMDGGRVVRALLATQMEYTRATQIAAYLGQSMALIFGLLGFLYSPMLMFIALFVWIGASQEANLVEVKSVLAGIPLRAAMQTSFETISPNDSLDHVTRLLLAGAQPDFPVVQGDQVVGVVTRDILIKSLGQKEDLLVSDIMHREIVVADASDMLESSLQRLQECNCRTLPVMQNNRLVGLLTTENLGEFIMIQSALKHRTAVAGH
jgi:Zn-dependent protease